MPSAAALTASLFILTAALCIYAETSRRPRRQRMAALIALVTVTAADAALLGHVPELGLAWPTVESAGKASPRRRVVMDRDGGSSDPAAAHDAEHRRALQEQRGSGEDGEGEEAEDEVVVVTLPRAASWGMVPAAKPGTGSATRPLAWDTIKDCPECPEMVVVPAGEAVIGAGSMDPHADAAEQPARVVRFWPGFAIARFEITAAELARSGRSGAGAGNRCAPPAARGGHPDPGPAACVTWGEAFAYAAWLGAKTGRRYRLPSAAEWEYAARLAAAPRVVASSGDPAAALGVRPEAMGGGVAEYAADCWADTLENASETSAAFLRNGPCYRRILKDGSESEDRRWRRASARRPVEPDAASPLIGFRVVREVE